MRTISQAELHLIKEENSDEKHKTADLTKRNQEKINASITSQLVEIGRLVRISYRKAEVGDKGENLKETRRLTFQVLPDFDEGLLPFDELFLVLERNKVRYVNLSGQKHEKGKEYAQTRVFLEGSKIILDLHDKSLSNEVVEAKSVYIAVDTDIYQEKLAPQLSLIGMNVMHLEEQIGTVVDVFDNGAHFVIEVETLDKKEVLLPDVDEYVVNKDFENNTIVFTNIQDFLEL